MIVVDTSVIYALLDGADAWHERVAEWYQTSRPSFTTTPLVLAEVDHLAASRAGRHAQAAWRRDLDAGAYDVHWRAEMVPRSIEVAERYGDLGVDLTDASVVVLADRMSTTEIATLDERHFRAMRPLSGGPSFRLLPIDA